MKKKIFHMGLCCALFASGLTMGSCNDDDSGGGGGQEPTVFPAEKPTTDFVKHTYGDKVAFLGADTKFVSFFKKRFSQIDTDITDATRVVVLDNAIAANFLTDGALFEKLQKIWDRNGICIFLNPGSNAVELHHQLLTGKRTATGEDQKDLAKNYDNLLLHAVTGSGHSLYYANPEVQHKSYVTINKLTGEETTEEKVYTFEPNDYQWGEIADNTCEWIIKNMAAEHATPHKSLVRATSDYTLDGIIYTYYCPVTVLHDLVEKVGYGTSPAPTYTNARYEYTVTSAFNESMQCDVYDVSLTQDFPANETYVKNVVTKTSAAYKYKYSGGNYSGPTVEAYLFSHSDALQLNESTVDLYAMSPLPEAGTYSTTHDPGSLTIGGSVTAGASGVSGSFSCVATLPKTTQTTVEEEMPVSFSRKDAHAYWEYMQDKDIYDYRAGLNPVYLGPPDFSMKYCMTNQAVTFAVKDSKKLADSRVYLHTYMNYKTFHETDSPWDWFIRIYNHGFKMDYTLPLTLRYFEKYTPYRFYSSAPADDTGWKNLEDMLKGNVNYRSLCDEMLKVGGNTEAALKKNAEDIWKETITSLINQYQGTKTAHEYIVALADTKGNKQAIGLHIKDGVWTQIKMTE